VSDAGVTTTKATGPGSGSPGDAPPHAATSQAAAVARVVSAHRGARAGYTDIAWVRATGWQIPHPAPTVPRGTNRRKAPGSGATGTALPTKPPITHTCK
jgi:hypothetical protein